MKTLDVEQIYLDLPPILTENDTVALDLELSGLKESQLHRPAGKFVSLAACFDGKNVYLIEDDDQVQEFLDRISKSTWVFHNSTFDLGHLKRWAKIEERKNMRDTLLIERLMFSGLYSDFGLNDLVRRYLKCYMPKDVRESFSEHEGRMTQEQIEYAAKDVVGTWLVDKAQQAIISEQDKKLWNGLYNPHVWTTLDLDGFYVNQDCWRELTAHYQETVDRLSTELGNKYGTTVKKMVGRGKARTEVEEFVPYNPSSVPQTLTILRSQGLDIEGTDEKTLTHYIEDSQFIKDLLEYRKAKKQVSTYGLDFLDYVEADSRIYTSLNIGLAVSGRDCVHEDTILNTDMGDFAISELPLTAVGFCSILTHTGNQQKILRKIYKGKEDMFEVTLDNGNSIKCTMGHKFLTDKGWKHLYELKAGDSLLDPPPPNRKSEKGS